MPSTRHLYAIKSSVFSDWCTIPNEDPTACDASLLLSFLQEQLDKGHTPSTLKVYMVVIAANNTLVATQSKGRNDLVINFLKGARRLKPPHPLTIPT